MAGTTFSWPEQPGTRRELCRLLDAPHEAVNELAEIGRRSRETLAARLAILLSSKKLGRQRRHGWRNSATSEYEGQHGAGII